MNSYPKLQRIDHESRLYVIDYGSHISCLGWDVAEDRAQKYAAWVGMRHAIEARGTEAHYAMYECTLKAAQDWAASTGARCNAFLVPELIDREGKRVEVTYPDGTRKRFKVGKSTGWAPCHLEMHNARSRGGGSVYWPKGTKLTQVLR